MPAAYGVRLDGRSGALERRLGILQPALPQVREGQAPHGVDHLRRLRELGQLADRGREVRITLGGRSAQAQLPT